MNIIFKSSGTMWGQPICDLHSDLYNCVWGDFRLCKRLKCKYLNDVEISSVRISSIFQQYTRQI